MDFEIFTSSLKNGTYKTNLLLQTILLIDNFVAIKPENSYNSNSAFEINLEVKRNYNTFIHHYRASIMLQLQV